MVCLKLLTELGDKPSLEQWLVFKVRLQRNLKELARETGKGVQRKHAKLLRKRDRLEKKRIAGLKPSRVKTQK